MYVFAHVCVLSARERLLCVLESIVCVSERERESVVCVY